MVNLIFVLYRQPITDCSTKHLLNCMQNIIKRVAFQEIAMIKIVQCYCTEIQLAINIS